MNIRTSLILLVITSAQAKDLQNLGFDDPNLSHKTIGPGGIAQAPTGDLLPGWSLTAVGGSAPTIGRIDVPGFPFSLDVAQPVPGFDFGSHSVFLGPRSLPPPDSVEYHLSQTGLIPQGASRLDFYAYVSLVDSLGDPSSKPVSLLINGVPAAYTRYATTITYSADISAYAGQDVNLEFVFIPKSLTSFDIAPFEIVPEPSTMALVTIGSISLFVWGLGEHFRRRQ